MYKIVVKNSHIEINDYTLGDCKRLENNFMLFDKTNFCYYPLGMYYDAEKSILYLPRGIDIRYVENCFGCMAYRDNNFTPYGDTGEIKLRKLPRDEVQKEALRFMIGVKEYESNKYKSQIGLNLGTGKGKTYTSIACISYFEMKSIIITTSIDWLNQWREAFTTFSTISNKEICMISGSPIINRLMKKGGDKYKVFLVTHASINSYATTYGWDKVGKLFEVLKIGAVFYDEAHKNFGNISMIDFHSNVYKTYYITATPARSSEDENRIYGLYFKNMPSIELFDENTDPHTNYIALKFNSRPSAFDISSCNNQYGLNRIAYTEYVVRKPEFYKLLRIIMNIILARGGKTLFYIGTNNAILIVKQWLIYNYPEIANDIGVYTSVISPDMKRAQLDKRIILSTTKSFGEAVDCKGLKTTVNLAEPFKSEVLARQTLGRTRDNDTYYMDVIDTGFVQLRAYNSAKRPIFLKYALTVNDVVISDYDLERLDKAICEKRKTIMKPLIIIDPEPQKVVKDLIYFCDPDR